MSIYIVGVITVLIFMLLILGAPIKIFRVLGEVGIKLIIGALLLYGINVVGSRMGIHIPINEVTVGVSGLLGIPGLITLVAIDQFFI